MSLIFKVCKKNEWEEAVNQGFYNGSDIDIKDG
ncbi:MAG: dihydroorotate dehydrogenase, partial [SAR116 cluster bacterium]|nr:dihydroorotate dehydrogenase [SAR116 cluster bacterium]